jgi:hypothetical protein
LGQFTLTTANSVINEFQHVSRSPARADECKQHSDEVPNVSRNGLSDFESSYVMMMFHGISNKHNLWSRREPFRWYSTP